MTRTVELWMHPDALQAAQRLLITDQSRSVVRRSMAVFDSLVESCRTHATVSEAVQAVSPAPLARTEWLAPMVRNSWPSTPEGGEIAAACQEILLCVYQIGALRSVIAIVACHREWYVVWLKVEYGYGRKDNFGDDTDTALAQQLLYGSLGLLTKLEWLEEA